MSEETKNPGMEPETKETEPEQELEQNGAPEESGVAVQPEPEQPSLEQQLAVLGKELGQARHPNQPSPAKPGQHSNGGWRTHPPLLFPLFSPD